MLTRSGGPNVAIDLAVVSVKSMKCRADSAVKILGLSWPMGGVALHSHRALPAPWRAYLIKVKRRHRPIESSIRHNPSLKNGRHRSVHGHDEEGRIWPSVDLPSEKSVPTPQLVTRARFDLCCFFQRKHRSSKRFGFYTQWRFRGLIRKMRETSWSYSKFNHQLVPTNSFIK